MKMLTPSEIECLLGIRGSADHPLDILGYGYTSEGARRFRAERPDFLPQISAYVQSSLQKMGIFPSVIDPENPGFRTFIRADRGLFRISSMEETGLSRYERIITDLMPETEAINEYIRRVVNSDYVHVAK